MHQLEADHDFKAEADNLWKLLENFGDITAWWPVGGPVDILEVVLEGEGVGMIRHIYNVGMAAPVSEQLDYIDPANRTYHLSLVGQRPAGILSYSAVGKLREISPGQCRLEYQARFDAEPGREKEARDFLLGAYQLMFAGLEQAAARQSL